MGRLIEESRTTTPMSNDEIVENLKTMVFGKQAFERFDAKERETLDKAWNIIYQYENRLKADMVATLTELKGEIEETAKDAHINAFMNGYKDMYLNGISASAIKCSEIIQEKINSLKEGTDGENNN